MLFDIAGTDQHRVVARRPSSVISYTDRCCAVIPGGSILRNLEVTLAQMNILIICKYLLPCLGSGQRLWKFAWKLGWTLNLPVHCSSLARAKYIVVDRHLDKVTPVFFNSWLYPITISPQDNAVDPLTPGYRLFTRMLLLLTPSGAIIPRATLKS